MHLPGCGAVAAAALATVLLAGCDLGGDDDEAARAPSATAPQDAGADEGGENEGGENEGGEPAGGAAGSVPTADPGDCFTFVEGGAFSADGITSCDAPHDGEVFALIEFTDDAFPGVDAMQTAAEQTCREDFFEDYVGSDYASSRYYIGTILPSEGSWGGGDREALCYLRLRDGSTTSGAARGSGE